MKKSPFRIRFSMQIYCGGLISHTPEHTTVLAFTAEEAIEKFKSSIRVGDAEWDTLGKAISIVEIKRIELS